VGASAQELAERLLPSVSVSPAFNRRCNWRALSMSIGLSCPQAAFAPPRTRIEVIIAMPATTAFAVRIAITFV
jgi:hypothetical protein